MTKPADVKAVNRYKELALLDDGEVIRVSDWFDTEGQPCDSEDAVVCVAGPTTTGKWFSIDLTQFKEEVTH